MNINSVVSGDTMTEYHRLEGETKGPEVLAYNPRQPNAPQENLEIPGGGFNMTIGEIPFRNPNVRMGREYEDIFNYVNKENETNPIVKFILRSLCCFTGVGACYLWGKTVLIKEGEYGFAMNNGRPEVLLPGRHLLSSPFNQHIGTRSSGDDRIELSPVSIIRVPEGMFGMATFNGQPEVLLPGVHVRKSAAFKFSASYSLQDAVIEFGPIKLLTVRSGTVRVCYNAGIVQILKEGRYAINSGVFNIAESITTQQQNIRFSQHPVLLDGGIGMLVEGLLTYQVVDVEKLIKELGDRDLLRAIQDVTKAELSRVFSTIHLEQIASSNQTKQDALLGQQRKEEREGVPAAECRTVICSQVIAAISPFTKPWGVTIINFQLESTRIADRKYAEEYEEASLGLAKAKANQRAVEAQNNIMLQKARAEANAVKIVAEGKKQAKILEAEGEAEARKIEARARNEAAEMMNDEFAKSFAMAGQQVEFARALKATSLTVLPDSAVGRPVVSGMGGFALQQGKNQ